MFLVVKMHLQENPHQSEPIDAPDGITSVQIIMCKIGWSVPLKYPALFQDYCVPADFLSMIISLPSLYGPNEFAHPTLLSQFID